MPPTIPYLNGLKFCSRCQKYKELFGFTKDKNRRDGLYTYCKLCKSVDAKVYHHNPINNRKQKDKERFLRKHYNMSLENWNLLFLSQGRQCAICKTEDPKDVYGRWHTDHNHITKKVRGILCRHCNLAVGQAEHGWSLVIPEIEKYLEFYS